MATEHPEFFSMPLWPKTNIFWWSPGTRDILPTAERFAVEVSLPGSMTNSQVSRDSDSNLDFPHVYRSTNRAIVAQYTLKAEVEEKMKGTTATSEAN